MQFLIEDRHHDANVLTWFPAPDNVGTEAFRFEGSIVISMYMYLKNKDSEKTDLLARTKVVLSIVCASLFSG